MKPIGLFLIGLGFLLSIFGITFVIDGFSVKNWGEINGKITGIQIKTYLSLNDNTTGEKHQREYYPVIGYQYEVDGQSYQSDRYKLGETHPKFSERAAATNAASHFKTGDAIAVYYNPEEPSSAVIDQSFSWPVFMPIVLGLLLAGTGFGIYKIPQQQAAA